MVRHFAIPAIFLHFFKKFYDSLFFAFVEMGLVKEVDQMTDMEYRESCPYDAMGDYSVIENCIRESDEDVGSQDDIKA